VVFAGPTNETLGRISLGTPFAILGFLTVAMVLGGSLGLPMLNMMVLFGCGLVTAGGFAAFGLAWQHKRWRLLAKKADELERWGARQLGEEHPLTSAVRDFRVFAARARSFRHLTDASVKLEYLRQRMISGDS
jgi:hypothetical protein